MKYLKIYENFVKHRRYNHNTHNIDDYEIWYFFEELIEDYDLKIDDVYNIREFFTKEFRFTLSGKLVDKIQVQRAVPDKNFFYHTAKKNDIDTNKIFSKCGKLAKPLKKLVERVELLGGGIVLVKTDKLYVHISFKTFEMFKNEN